MIDSHPSQPIPPSALPWLSQFSVCERSILGDLALDGCSVWPYGMSSKVGLL